MMKKRSYSVDILCKMYTYSVHFHLYMLQSSHIPLGVCKKKQHSTVLVNVNGFVDTYCEFQNNLPYFEHPGIRTCFFFAE